MKGPDFEELVRILTDPDIRAGKHLPQEEQDRYQRNAESIVQARQYAQSHAHEFWVF